MDTLEAIYTSMRRTFDGDAESELARALVDFLAAHPSTSHVTLQLMRQMAIANSNDIRIVRTLQYLSGDSIQLLDTRFELIEDDDLSPVPLTAEEVAAATRDSVNPVSGYPDAEVAKKIAVFFSPTNLLRDILMSSPMKGGV